MTALPELLDHSPLDVLCYGLAELLSESHSLSNQVRLPLQKLLARRRAVKIRHLLHFLGSEMPRINLSAGIQERIEMGIHHVHHRWHQRIKIACDLRAALGDERL